MLFPHLEEYELLTLKWFSCHKVPISNSQQHIPSHFLKSSLELIYSGFLIEENGFYSLSPTALDQLKHADILQRRHDRYNFLMGVVSGIAATLFLDCFLPYLLSLFIW